MERILRACLMFACQLVKSFLWILLLLSAIFPFPYFCRNKCCLSNEEADLIPRLITFFMVRGMTDRRRNLSAITPSSLGLYEQMDSVEIRAVIKYFLKGLFVMR